MSPNPSIVFFIGACAAIIGVFLAIHLALFVSQIEKKLHEAGKKSRLLSRTIDMRGKTADTRENCGKRIKKLHVGKKSPSGGCRSLWLFLSFFFSYACFGIGKCLTAII